MGHPQPVPVSHGVVHDDVYQIWLALHFLQHKHCCQGGYFFITGNRFATCLAACLAGCLLAWLPGFLAARLPGCLAAWLPGCPAAWLPHCVPVCPPACPARPLEGLAACLRCCQASAALAKLWLRALPPAAAFPGAMLPLPKAWRGPRCVVKRV